MKSESPRRSELRESLDYQLEVAQLVLGESLVQRMESANVTRSELAERLNVTKARVSQILAGDDNLTLKSLVALARALDCELRIELAPKARISAPPPGPVRARVTAPIAAEA